MATSGCRLEDRAHELREIGIDVDDLLELVEDERDLPPALGRELAGQLKSRSSVTSRSCGCRPASKLNPSLPCRIDRDDRRDPQAREDPQALARAEERRGEVVVDRLRELLGEASPSSASS